VASTWYVDGTNGNPANNGTTPLLAKLTVAQALALASAGDTISMSGPINEAISTALAGLSFVQTPDFPAFDWHGMSTATYSLHFGSTYKASVGAASPNAVCDDWVNKTYTDPVTGDVIHCGYLPKVTAPGVGADLKTSGSTTAVSVANPAVVTSAGHGFIAGTYVPVTIAGTNCTPSINQTWNALVIDANTFSIPVSVTAVTSGAGTWTIPGAWGYTNPTLYVRRADNSSAIGQPVLWANPAFGRLLDMTSASGGYRVDGSRASGGALGRIRQALSSTTLGYGVTANGPNNTYIDLEVWDCTVHNAIFYSSDDRNNQMIRVKCGGGFSAAAQLFTNYASSGQITGCRYSACTALCYTLKDKNGFPIFGWGATGIGGFYSHGNDGAGVVDDLEYLPGCIVKFFDNEVGPGNDFDSASVNTTRVPSDIYNGNTYPVRITGCYTFNAYELSASGNIYRRRSFIDSPRRLAYVISAAGRYTGFGANVFKWAGEAFPDQPCFVIGAGAEIVRLNNTFINYRVSSTSFRDYSYTSSAAAFNGGVAGFKSHGYGNVIFFHDTGGLGRNRLWLNDSGAPATNFDEHTNWYYQIDGTNNYSADVTRDTEGEFISTIDATGIYDVDPQLSNYADTAFATAGKPLPGGALATRVVTLAHYEPIGYNGLPYSGRMGAWQDGVAQRDGHGGGDARIARVLRV